MYLLGDLPGSSDPSRQVALVKLGDHKTKSHECWKGTGGRGAGTNKDEREIRECGGESKQNALYRLDDVTEETFKSLEHCGTGALKHCLNL